MKINQKICSILVILFALITISIVILHFTNLIDTNLDTMMIFLGLTTFCGGLNSINMAQQTDSKKIAKACKMSGLFSIVVGIIILILVIIKMIL